MTPLRSNRPSVSRVLGKPSCLDGCVKERFDPMTPDEFADFVANNPLESPTIFYYLSICTPPRNQELIEGFGRHPYFTQEPCKCYGKPKNPILVLDYDVSKTSGAVTTG